MVCPLPIPCPWDHQNGVPITHPLSMGALEWCTLYPSLRSIRICTYPLGALEYVPFTCPLAPVLECVPFTWPLGALEYVPFTRLLAPVLEYPSLGSIRICTLYPSLGSIGMCTLYPFLGSTLLWSIYLGSGALEWCTLSPSLVPWSTRMV